MGPLLEVVRRRAVARLRMGSLRKLSLGNRLMQ